MSLSRMQLRRLISETVLQEQEEQQFLGFDLVPDHPGALKFKTPLTAPIRAMFDKLKKELNAANIDPENYYLAKSYYPDYIEKGTPGIFGATGLSLGISEEGDPYTYKPVGGGKLMVVSGPRPGSVGKTFKPKKEITPDPKPGGLDPQPPVASKREFPFDIAWRHTDLVSKNLGEVIADLEELEEAISGDRDSKLGMGNDNQYFVPGSNEYSSRPSNRLRYVQGLFGSLSQFIQRSLNQGLISGADFDEAKEMYNEAAQALVDIRADTAKLSKKMRRVIEKSRNADSTKITRQSVELFYAKDDPFHGNLRVLSQDFANPANQGPGYEGAPGAGRSADEPMAPLGESMSRGSLYRRRYFGRY